MKYPIIKRDRLFSVRFTKAEFESIQQKSNSSTCQRIGEFIRRCVLDKPIVIRQRNQSLDDFMAELMKLRDDLKSIGHTFNESVRLLHQRMEAASISEFIDAYEADRFSLFNRMENIQQRINQFADLWLQ